MTRLGTKILGAIVVTFMVIGLVFMMISQYLETQRRQTLTTQLKLLMESVFEAHSDDIANAIYAGHTLVLREMVKDIGGIEGVVGVAVYDSEGKELIASGHYVDTVLAPDERQLLARGEYFQQTARRGEAVAEYAVGVTVIGNNIGYFRICYSLTESTAQARYNLLLLLAILICLFVFMTAVLALLLNRFVIRPVRNLGVAMAEVREGDYGKEVEVRGDDEVAAMAAAFNRMSVQLQQNRLELMDAIEEKNRNQLELAATNRRLESFNHELEREVRKRTHELFETNRLLRLEAKEREQAEAQYRSIFDNALVGIFQSTMDGRFIKVNPAAARILGYPSPAALMAEVTDLGRQLYVHSEDRKRFLATLREKGAVERYTTELYRRDKAIVCVELNATNVIDSDGGLICIEGVITDITPQHVAKQERERLEGQLRQSQKLEALGNLAGGVAHDFNNLLQALSGYIQLMLMRQGRDDKDYKYLKEMDRAVGNGSLLIRQLLTFSRKMEVHFQAVSLNEITETTITLLKRTLPKMVAIETSLDPELSPILADPTQMEQVLMNLATNAVDAMEGAGVLTIETQNFPINAVYKNRYVELPSGDYILVKISDSGKGMDEATRQRIFEPFFTTKEEGKGTGLGLATVYGIVTNHKGYIGCYSEPGQGTTFKIFLPVGGRGVMTAEEPTVAGQLSEGEETILLVDDEASIAEIAEELLIELGYTVFSAASGEEALEIYLNRREEIDLIIMDIGMPGIGGERCLEELLRIDPAVRVIMASGYSAHKIAKEPQRYGAAGFIPKPYRLDHLAAKVREVLDDL